MVNALARPISSLILQLLSGSHIPATGARPVEAKTVARTPVCVGDYTCFSARVLGHMYVHTARS